MESACEGQADEPILVDDLDAAAGGRDRDGLAVVAAQTGLADHAQVGCADHEMAL